MLDDYATALNYIHSIENEYGSIAKTPLADNRLAKARELLNGISGKSAKEKNQAIVADLEAGYSQREIAERFNIAVSTVTRMKSHLKVIVPPIFRWVIYKNRQIYGVSTTHMGMIKFAGLCTGLKINNLREFQELQAVAKEKGFDIQKSTFRWYELPINTVYVIRDQVRVKKSKDYVEEFKNKKANN